MSAKKSRKTTSAKGTAKRVSTAASAASSPVEQILLAAMERGDDSLETGRYLITFKEDALEAGVESFGAQRMRLADARDFEDQAVSLESVGDADAVVFPEIGVALVSGDAAQERGMSIQAEVASDSPIEVIEPEYFVFAEATTLEFARGLAEGTEAQPGDYMRGFLRAAVTIAEDVGTTIVPVREVEEEEVLAVGATWGLIACKVPPSVRSGLGIKLAVLDTGMDLRHPDFAGRAVVSQQFVGQPVQDLHSHGTHCIGTACGPKAPAGSTPRYGIAYRSAIFVGKVLTNSGSGTSGSVLAGMNWAIANRCTVISMSLGSQTGAVTAYTAAGRAALNNGLLIIAAAGNAASFTGAPANSPTIMSVASLDKDLRPSSFSNFGKIEIAAPGRDVFSSVPRPTRYGFKSGTSMATPHVAGCAALWAETSPALRGINLWRKLQGTAKHLPLPVSKVGAGLVQAP